MVLLEESSYLYYCIALDRAYSQFCEILVTPAI